MQKEDTNVQHRMSPATKPWPRAVLLAACLVAAWPAVCDARAEGDDVAEAVRLARAALAKRASETPSPEEASVAGRARKILLAAALDHTAPTEEDVDWLIDQQADTGGWGFGQGHPHTDIHPDWTDMVNTQLAVAALRRAQEAGLDVPTKVFEQAMAWTLACQNADGGWGYTPPDTRPLRVRGASHGSATAAALALLVDCPTPTNNAQRTERAESLASGLEWFEAHIVLDRVPQWVWGSDEPWCYYMFCLQRFTRATGRWAIAGQKLGVEIRHRLLARQGADGSWDGREETAETGYALLALADAGKSVFVSRLALIDSDTDDAANWMAYLKAATGRHYSWQSISIEAPLASLAEATIVYVLAGEKLEMPPSWAQGLRQFAERGGAVVVIAGSDKEEAVPTLARELVALLGRWPMLADLDGHALFKAKFKLAAKSRPELIVIGDGARPVGVVLPPAVAAQLAAGVDDETAAAFELMVNLAIAATGQDPPAGRESFGAAPVAPTRAIHVARIKHAGDWNIAPMALRRLSDTLVAALSIGVQEIAPVDLNGGELSQSVLWLAGTRHAQLTLLQQKNLKAYLEAGGTLFVDSAMGREAFLRNASGTLARMFGPDALAKLPQDHPLLTGQFAGGIGNNLRDAHYTEATPNPPKSVELSGIELDGRLAVIVGRCGVTPAIEGTAALGRWGLQRDDARRLAINVLLYAISGDPGE